MLLAFVVAPEADTLRELVGFERKHISAGGAAAVLVSIAPQVLARVDADGAMVVTPGIYTIEFGVDGASERRAVRTSLELHGEAITVFNLTAVLGKEHEAYVI